MKKEPVRILHVIGIMNRGGSETMIMNLYRKIDRTKVQFDFVENSFEKAVFDEEILSLGGRIFRCPHYNGKNHFEYKKWWNDFFKTHPEYKIIHGHIGSTAAIYLKIAKKYGCYTIAHSHSEFSIRNKGGLIYSIYNYPTRYIADYFFACSKLSGISRFGNKVVKGNNYKILNNAIDLNGFSFNEQVRNKMRESLNITDEIVLGHVGRMDDNKNQIFLLKLLQEMIKKQLNVKLILIGTGVNFNSLREEATKLNLDDSVVFTGVRTDISELMQAMDCFVFPSFYEGLPVTLVEAQATGLPCVISDTINDEVKLTKEVCKLSLKDSFDTWMNKILEYTSSKDRKNNYEAITKEGFNIDETSKWMEDFYLDVYENRK